VVDPPELAGSPAPVPPVPGPAARRFVESKAIASADPNTPSTIVPAIQDLNEIIALEPNNSDFYLARATLTCEMRGDVSAAVEDINHSIALHNSGKSSAYPTLKDHYALRSKLKFQQGRLEDSMRDLDSAIQIDYDSAEEVFNDGDTKTSEASRPCQWTKPDLLELQQRYPNDLRPHLYLGLYLAFFHKFDLESDYKDVFEEYQRAIELNPASPLPYFFAGKTYTAGGLGGFLSIKNAKCLGDLVPRTPEC
jgi:tetratricopeptide (TPR) repeat protein